MRVDKLNNVITYTVYKTNTSSVLLSIENNEVIIKAPSNYTNEDIEKILLSKRDWIIEKLTGAKEQSYKGTVPYKPDNTDIFGKNYRIDLEYANISSPKLTVNDSNIFILLPLEYRHTNNSNLLKTMLIKMQTKIIESELDYIFEEARITLGIAPEDIIVKKLNGRVTYVTDDKKIIIDPSIVSYEKNIIEFIIFHTFCHLLYKTHSIKFNKIMKDCFDNLDELLLKTKNLNF